MNPINDNTLKPNSGVDIFSMQPSTKKGTAAPEAQIEPPKSAAKKSAVSDFVSKLGPAHLGVAVALGAAVWIAWPYIFDSSLPNTAVHGSPRMLTPSEAMSNAGHAQLNNAPGSSIAQASQSPGTTDITTEKSGVMPSDAPTIKSEPNAAPPQPTEKEVELQAKVEELQGKIALVEAQLAKYPVKAADTASKSKPRMHRVSRSLHPRTSMPSKSPSSEEESKQISFTLNTIYRDQAWIQNSDQTYVVQEGDVIDGMRIVRIDPLARQVITSLGTIR